LPFSIQRPYFQSVLLSLAAKPRPEAVNKPVFVPFLDKNPSHKIISGIAEMILGVPEMVSGVAEIISGVAEMVLGIAKTVSGVPKMVLGIAKISSGIAVFILGSAKIVSVDPFFVLAVAETISASAGLGRGDGPEDL
jgi:hypothetical protein